MPPCTNCNQTNTTITGYIPANCTDGSSCDIDASCVAYTGPALSCAGIDTYDRLDQILQKIDPLLCASVGDYSGYNTYCLAPVTTQQQFVEKISEYVCSFRTSYNTFVNTTFVNYQSSVSASLNQIINPNIICASAGVVSTDPLVQVLQKYCSKFSTIDTALSLTGVNWTSCFSVGFVPSTLVQGFNVVIGQICQLKSYIDTITGGGSGLPTFNNVGSCLDSPTTTDSLVDTVNKIKTKLCQTGAISLATITWGCVSPSTGSNLQGALQNIASKITSISQALPVQFGADFVVTNVDNANLCLGKKIELAVPSAADRLVAATAGDTTPGTLQAKLVAGTNFSLDYLTTPGQVILNATPAVSDTYTVKTDVGDTTPGFLGVKIASGGISNGVQVLPSLDATNHLVVLNAAVDPIALFTSLIQAAENDPGLKTLLCNLVATCPSPCAAPSNIEVTYDSGA